MYIIQIGQEGVWRDDESYTDREEAFARYHRLADAFLDVRLVHRQDVVILEQQRSVFDYD